MEQKRWIVGPKRFVITMSRRKSMHERSTALDDRKSTPGSIYRKVCLLCSSFSYYELEIEHTNTDLGVRLQPIVTKNRHPLAACLFLLDFTLGLSPNTRTDPSPTISYWIEISFLRLFCVCQDSTMWKKRHDLEENTRSIHGEHDLSHR